MRDDDNDDDDVGVVEVPSELGEALHRALSRRQRKQTESLDDDAVMLMLDRYYNATYGTPKETFSPGQIIWHRISDISTVSGADKPAIFLRYLDVPVHAMSLAREPVDITSSASTLIVDCVVGVLFPNKGSEGWHVAEMPGDSRWFTVTKPGSRAN